jgi:hypothetical protein
MANVARGKALVAQLRARPDVRDAEALAAWIGRVKKLKKGGMSTKAAMRAARSPKSKPKRSALADIAEEYQPSEAQKSGGEKRLEKYEAALVNKMEKEERSKLYNAIHEVGGIKSRDDLREEYRAIPNNLKRKDGLKGDEMADYLGTYYQELGIYSENDLLDYFAPDYRRAG